VQSRQRTTKGDGQPAAVIGVARRGSAGVIRPIAQSWDKVYKGGHVSQQCTTRTVEQTALRQFTQEVKFRGVD